MVSVPSPSPVSSVSFQKRARHEIGCNNVSLPFANSWQQEQISLLGCSPQYHDGSDSSTLTKDLWVASSPSPTPTDDGAPQLLYKLYNHSSMNNVYRSHDCSSILVCISWCQMSILLWFFLSVCGQSLLQWPLIFNWISWNDDWGF